MTCCAIIRVMNTSNQRASDTSVWLSAGPLDSARLGQISRDGVAARVAAGKFRENDVEYIRAMKLPVVEGALQVSDRQLEKLRRLCQLAEVDLIPARISSHRPLIGPVIVGVKRVLFSVLKVLFKDTFRKQRDFNAAVISYLAESARLDKQEH